MSVSIDNAVPHTPEAPGAWWQNGSDDIFARVADTARQQRPACVVIEALTGLRHEPPALPEPPRPSLRRMATQPPAAQTLATTIRVLLADDDQVLQRILRYQLAQHDWEVTCSGDGVEVERLLALGQVDVLLIDLDLPHRNAYEILGYARGLPTAPRIVVMSEQRQDEKIVRAFELGADDFVHKPISARVLMSRVQRLLER